MPRIDVATVINARPREVWAAIEDIASHVRWMADAEAIHFRGEQRQGVGTVFDCDTRVGPLRLRDEMEITQWKPRRRMGVRHTGVVTGSGVFTLRRLRGGRTRFSWSERLVFPWWLGGPVGGTVGGLVLRLVWRRNLRSLRRLIETPAR